MSNNTHKKLGFWSIFAIVTGSQIGTGAFMLPVSLAPYGYYSLWGWIISGIGAVLLCLVFASLCARFPETGGPHAYVKHAFGNTAAFFVGWTYWLISWVSSTAVVVTTVSSLNVLISDQNQFVYLILEILIVLSVAMLNCRGLEIASKVEFVLTIIKFIPLFCISVFALRFFDSNNLTLDTQIAQMSIGHILGRVTLLTLWGFIGLECATTPADSVISPSRTIPKAIILGTLSVASLYIINNIAIMGLIPGQQLLKSSSPYADAAQMLFGHNYSIFISYIISIICLGTLNAWVMASSQVALGLSMSNLMPKLFSSKNAHNAPVFAILISALGMIPLLIMTTSETLSTQINMIIDFSVVAFIFVYLACCIALLKISYKDLFNQESTSNKVGVMSRIIISLISAIFCLWVVFETPFNVTLVSIGFVLTALPMYFLWYIPSASRSRV